MIVLSPDASYVRGYPDAANPGDAMRTKIDVVVRIDAPKANVPIQLKWHDVDDPAHGAPIDPTDPPMGTIRTNPADNYSGGRAGDDASLPPGPYLSDANGEVRRTFTRIWPQPGNNYRVAAGPAGPGREAEFNPLKPLARDGMGRLFYDRNDDNALGQPPDELVLDEMSSHKGIKLTPELKLWRKLHVEVDSMGAIHSNKLPNSTGQVVDNQDGTSTVHLASWLIGHDENQFENGRLTDYIGQTFRIKESHSDRVFVYNNGPTIPTAGDPIYLEDDDYMNFADGQDVPMPNTEELGTPWPRRTLRSSSTSETATTMCLSG